MITVAPSTSYEATLELGITGLVGTLAVGTYDGDTATQALATSGINEIGSSGIYVATRTSPGTAGQYVLIWSQDGTLTDPDLLATEDLLVSSTASSTTVGSGNLYVTRAELKTELNITVTTYDDRIDAIVSAVSRAIDRIQGTRYYTATDTRYYSPAYCDWMVQIHDLASITSLAVDMTGDGSYGTTWTNGTHFTLEPINNAADGLPYWEVVLRAQSGARFPGYRNSVRIVGSFGWDEVPAQIHEAAMLLASRLFNRKDAPFGALAIGGLDASAVVRIGKTDPDFMLMLESVGGRPKRLVA